MQRSFRRQHFRYLSYAIKITAKIHEKIREFRHPRKSPNAALQWFMSLVLQRSGCLFFCLLPVPILWWNVIGPSRWLAFLSYFRTSLSKSSVMPTQQPDNFVMKCFVCLLVRPIARKKAWLDLPTSLLAPSSYVEHMGAVTLYFQVHRQLRVTAAGGCLVPLYFPIGPSIHSGQMNPTPPVSQHLVIVLLSLLVCWDIQL